MQDIDVNHTSRTKEARAVKNPYRRRDLIMIHVNDVVGVIEFQKEVGGPSSGQ